MYKDSAVVEEVIRDWKHFLDNGLKLFKEYYSTKSCDKLQIKDFMLMRTIGTGSFGRVVLATLQVNYKPYAIKIVTKEKVVEKKHINHVLSERLVLQSIRFPFTVHMEFFFHDTSYLYFVLPFVQGGELFSLMHYIYRLSEDEARFYAAQIVLSLEYLHYVGLVYRDLKPENLLLDSKGYVKLTDFGFAKLLDEEGRTYTVCGTPDYISPEILSHTGYGRSVDWWSFGVLVYEFCNGITPFRNPNQTQNFDRITRGEYHMPDHFSPELKNLIERLLQTTIARRIGCLARGIAEIKEHAWFKTINWLGLINKNIEPPYVPKIISPLDDTLYETFSNHKLVISSQDKYEAEFKDFC